ncbi:MAG: hypothetical protein CMG66_05950 [Candidatus Marinimicrobia bacterium]|nr:hypothetical protein [Candidatus Neomarinimicrobiota bacterium]|tara:strand:- start:17687 stop:18100 length:414 start_codon:yes stop_codon:yes gene_type:complete
MFKKQDEEFDDGIIFFVSGLLKILFMVFGIPIVGFFFMMCFYDLSLLFANSVLAFFITDFKPGPYLFKVMVYDAFFKPETAITPVIMDSICQTALKAGTLTDSLEYICIRNREVLDSIRILDSTLYEAFKQVPPLNK